jgi:hypothetical protein
MATRGFGLKTVFGLRGSGGPNRQIPHANQVLGGCSEGEDPSNVEDSAIPNLAQQRDRLQPSEALFNALPFLLPDAIAGMVCGASINRAPAGPLQDLRSVRRDLKVSAFDHKVCCVVGLVATRVNCFVPGVGTSIASAASRSAVPLAPCQVALWKQESFLVLGPLA